jgi:membrane fusion protein, multidrug efflux system
MITPGFSCFKTGTVFLVFLILLSCSGTNPKEEKQGSARNKPISVIGFVVRPDTFNVEINAAGTILANESVELHPEASGRVTGIYFAEGEFVPKGKLLVKINDQELQAELQKAKFVESLAQSDENRKRQLLEGKGISQEEYEISQNRLKTAQAEVDLIEAQIAKTEVVAPFAGRIGLRNISEGAYISPTIAITALQQTNPVKIEFAVPQKYISLVQPGAEVTFTDEKGQEYRAAIYATDASIDEGMRSIRVRARYDNSGNKLVPGMFVNVKVRSEASKNAIVIPAEALIPIMDGEKVYTSSGGRAISHKVVSGYRTETKVEIRNGLKQGDTVLTTGLLMLRDSSLVKVDKIINR